MIVDFTDEVVNEVFNPNNSMYIVGMTVIHQGRRLGSKTTVTPEWHDRIIINPIERRTVLEMLRCEIQRVANELYPEIEHFNEAEHRHLRARWTREAQQDLRAMHNIDTEQALSQILANEFNREFDYNATIMKNSQKVDWKKEGF